VLKVDNYLFATFGLPKLIQILWLSMRSSQKIEYGTLEEKTEDMIFLKELIETGVIKSVVDSKYPLEQAAEGHRYVDSGQK
jgi:NADPH:quinone reductase-like Zn-dependent oxidoreductase